MREQYIDEQGLLFINLILAVVASLGYLIDQDLFLFGVLMIVIVHVQGLTYYVAALVENQIELMEHHREETSDEEEDEEDAPEQEEDADE